MRRSLQEASRGNRRHHRHTAQFRRRTGHRRDPAPGRSQRAGAGARLPDTPGKMTIADRRDSFCGKMSVCNNLQQFGIRYSLTALHTVDPVAGFPHDIAASRGLPCRPTACASCASEPSARAPRHSTLFAIARSFSKPTASPSRPSTSPRFSAASTAWLIPKAGQAKLDAIHTYVSTTAFPPSR